jgi:hypothetical protein
MVIDLLSGCFVEVNIFARIIQGQDGLRVIQFKHEWVEVFLLDVVVLLIGYVDARNYGDDL